MNASPRSIRFLDVARKRWQRQRRANAHARHRRRPLGGRPDGRRARRAAGRPSRRRRGHRARTDRANGPHTRPPRGAVRRADAGRNGAAAPPAHLPPDGACARRRHPSFGRREGRRDRPHRLGARRAKPPAGADRRPVDRHGRTSSAASTSPSPRSTCARSPSATARCGDRSPLADTLGSERYGTWLGTRSHRDRRLRRLRGQRHCGSASRSSTRRRGGCRRIDRAADFIAKSGDLLLGLRPGRVARRLRCWTGRRRFARRRAGIPGSAPSRRTAGTSMRTTSRPDRRGLRSWSTLEPARSPHGRRRRHSALCSPRASSCRAPRRSRR